jgi:hypothetical protein
LVSRLDGASGVGRRAGPLIVCAALASGCTLMAPLDGLTGSSSDAGGSPIDGPSLGDDGPAGPLDAGDASLDVSVDSSAGGGDSSVVDSGGVGPEGSMVTPDSGRAPDSGTTTQDSSTGDEPPPPVGFCAGLTPAPLFCDDFDEPGALSAPYDQLLTGGGAASSDGTYYVSSPHSLLTSVTANEAAANVDVAGYKSFTSKQGAAGTYTLSFDIRIDASDTTTNSDAVLGAIQLWNGSAAWDLELEVAYGNGSFTAWLTENGGSDYAQHAASKTLPSGAWTRVSIGITLPADSSGMAAATMSFGGTQVASSMVHVETSNPIPELIVGPTYASPSTGGWAVRYDNVTFE